MPHRRMGMPPRAISKKGFSSRAKGEHRTITVIQLWLDGPSLSVGRKASLLEKPRLQRGLRSAPLRIVSFHYVTHGPRPFMAETRVHIAPVAVPRKNGAFDAFRLTPQPCLIDSHGAALPLCSKAKLDPEGICHQHPDQQLDRGVRAHESGDSPGRPHSLFCVPHRGMNHHELPNAFECQHAH